MSYPFIGPIAGASGNQVMIPGATIPQGEPGAPSTAVVLGVYGNLQANNPNVFNINTTSNTLTSSGFSNVGGSGSVNAAGASIADDDGFIYSIDASSLGNWVLTKWNYSSQAQIAQIGPGLFSGPGGQISILDLPNQGPFAITVKLAAWGETITGTVNLVDRGGMVFLSGGSFGAGHIASMTFDKNGNLWVTSNDDGKLYCLQIQLTFSGAVLTGANVTVKFTVSFTTSAFGSVAYYPALDQVIVAYVDNANAGAHTLARVSSAGVVIGSGVLAPLAFLAQPRPDGTLVAYDDGVTPAFYFIDVTSITGVSASIRSYNVLRSNWALSNITPLPPSQDAQTIAVFDLATWSCWVIQESGGTGGPIYRLLFPLPDSIPVTLVVEAPTQPIIVPVTLTVEPPTTSIVVPVTLTVTPIVPTLPVVIPVTLTITPENCDVPISVLAKNVLERLEEI